jgi:hypothetical protein
MAAFAKTGGGSSGTVSAGRPSSQSCAEEIKPTEAQRKGNQNATKMQSKQSRQRLSRALSRGGRCRQ